MKTKPSKDTKKETSTGTILLPDYTASQIVRPYPSQSVRPSNITNIIFRIILSSMSMGASGSVVEALCYKPENRGFGSR
jgi:hypothetical protein